ncbi:MAG: hypothetical protein U5Q44_02715 [Dehalococcoidia bacterium]|nr:hypothetical protein [Dehalococcoidia bacterium]
MNLVRGMGYEELLHYEVVDGVAHVVFQEGDGQLTLDRTWISDQITFDWPPQPAWQLSGDWCHIGGTDNPASVQPVRSRGDGTVRRGR